jgi:hypothetical protein
VGDPRVASQATISKYQNAYYAEIVVISKKEYADLLKRGMGQYLDENGQPLIVLDDPANLTASTDIGQLVNTLHPPVNLYWDSTDPSATEFVSNSGSNTVNLVITFDPASDDVATDHDIRYDVSVTNIAASSTTAATPGSTAASNLPNVGTVNNPVHSSGHIQLTWKGITDATGYSITASGSNLPNASGKTTQVYHSNSSINATTGLHYWNLYPTAPTTFSGSYTFKIVAVYTNGVSKGAVTKNVSIT